MKYINEYKSFGFLNLKEIIANLNEILIDLSDVGIKYYISPNNDIKIKMLSLYLNKLLTKAPTFQIEIFFNSSNNTKQECVIETIERIKYYIESIDLKVYISLKHISGENAFIEIEDLEFELDTSLSDYIKIIIDNV
jgi:hypothetical protein